MQVYVIGDVGILEELDLKGYQYIGGPQDNDKKIELSPGYALEHDHDVRPVGLLGQHCIELNGAADGSTPYQPALGQIGRAHV